MNQRTREVPCMKSKQGSKISYDCRFKELKGKAKTQLLVSGMLVGGGEGWGSHIISLIELGYYI
jgi:hypothetical protein